MRPSVWVWMPISVDGWGRLGLSAPQMSIEYAVCQWSFTVGGSAAALLTLPRLTTISSVPTTTTRKRLEYQPQGVRPLAVRPPPVLAARATFLLLDALPI